MRFEDIYSIVGHVPYIEKRNAKYLYELILKEKPVDILELGIVHGTATCYMAAALDELGVGSITSVDLIGAKELFNPSVEAQLEEAGLSKYVSVVRMQTGYTWFLHDEIANNTKDDVCAEKYDLCIIDGPKNWTIDGAAFFFVDKLLKKNGWIIFDDYNWTYGKANTLRESTDGITHRTLSAEEKEIPHVKELFELLVKQHPDYGNFVLLADGDWALAQKTKNSKKTYSVNYLQRPIGIPGRIARKFRGLLKSALSK